MQEIKKLLRLPRLKYYEVHLSLINCILPKKMTPMEIRVVSAFMALEGDVALYRFGPTAKKIIRESFDPHLSPAGLSNYIGSLTEKGFLIKAGDITSILPILTPEKEQQVYMFKLINNG